MGIALRLAVKHPERNINALNFLNMVFVGETLGKENFPYAVLFQRLDGVLFAVLEGDNEIRFQLTGKLPGTTVGLPQ